MSFFTPTTILLLAAAYFLGSIPFGLLLAKLFAGKDIRESGSGNIGANNVARVVRPAAGLPNLILAAPQGSPPASVPGRFPHQECPAQNPSPRAAPLGPCL